MTGQVRELKTARATAASALEEQAPTKALAQLQKLLASVSQSTELLMLHARCLLQLKRPVEAAREAQKGARPSGRLARPPPKGPSSH